MNKIVSVVVIVVAIIAISGLFFPQATQQVKEVVVGAIAGPDIQTPYLNFNGDEVWYSSMAFNTASTTRCALRAPIHATSTLSFDSIVKSATSTDYTLTAAKSATAFATTTMIREEAVTAAGQVAFPIASSTYSSLADTNRTFAPGEWLVVSAAGPTPTAFTNGYCAAEFVVGR